MVVHGLLIEVGILAVVVVDKEVLGELHHVVGIAGLHTFPAGDEIAIFFLGRKPLTNGVATDGNSALPRDVLPKEPCSLAIGGRCALLVSALKANNLGNLRVGMHIVNGRGLSSGHAGEQPLVSIALGRLEITGIAGHLIGIGKHLVDAAMLHAQQSLHLAIGKMGYKVDAPVAELQKHGLGSFVIGIEPCIAKTGHGLVNVIEWHPRLPILVKMPYSQR